MLTVDRTFRDPHHRALDAAERQRIALMCTEKDPLDCHRTVLVARRLEEQGHRVSHIRADGTVEPHQKAMERLMQQLGMQPSLFSGEDEQLEEALATQEARISYVDADLREAVQGPVS